MRLEAHLLFSNVLGAPVPPCAGKRKSRGRTAKKLDAVVASVRVMEENPLFNAGRGAVFTSAGTHELDAAIMDGKTLKAGAVGRLTQVRNPIDLARAVMERSPHVMLVGEGAEQFAAE